MNTSTFEAAEESTAVRASQGSQGFALISALLMLVVMTILGLAMFRSFGLLERMAGNTREKQRALSLAGTAQTYAEWWLTTAGGANVTSGSICNSFVTVAQVCSNVLANPSSLPWAAGVSYSPPTPSGLPFTVNATAGTANTYASSPLLYISYLTGSYNSNTGTQNSVYQIDAMGNAGTTSTVAVVESTYAVSVTYTTQTNSTKFVNLGGS